MKLIGIKYIERAINIIYVITIISFLLFFPTLLIPSFYDSLAYFANNLKIDNALGGQNIIIYTVKGITAWNRNSGNFPEPGSFYTARTRIAASPSRGQCCSQMPQPMHNSRST